MVIEILTVIGPILGGLAGVAAVIKVFSDKSHNKHSAKTAEKQVEVSADDVSVRSEANVIEGYARLLTETREQFEDYREYTDQRFSEMSAKIKVLEDESMAKDERILLLTIDRDTLIQHVITGGGVPIPDLRTV